MMLINQNTQLSNPLKILNLELSNEYIIDLISRNEPFMITRVGIGAETYISSQYKKTNKINNYLIQSLNNNNGIYALEKNKIKIWCEQYIKAIEESTALATWDKYVIQDQCILKPDGIPSIHTRVLEPFYLCSKNVKPWSHYLKGKKILIISPFVDSIRRQNEANFQIFSDGKRIFLEDQEFVYYKAYNTSAGNHLHKDWAETFEIMCREVSKLDFDIALLGCGGYGLPLCRYIKSHMNKSVIYIGGGLQMIFGVMGKRWETTDYWKDVIQKHNPRFIRPCGDEILNNCHKVENACFW